MTAQILKGCWLASESEPKNRKTCAVQGKYYIQSTEKECLLLNVNVCIHVYFIYILHIISILFIYNIFHMISSTHPALPTY